MRGHNKPGTATPLNLPWVWQRNSGIPALQGPGVPGRTQLSPNEYQMSLGARFVQFTKNAFERKRLPSPGAQNYAYESLGLVGFTYIGPAVAARRSAHGFYGAMFPPLQQPPVYALQQAAVAGVGGLSAGQIIGQPLINMGNTFDMAAPPSDIPIL